MNICKLKRKEKPKYIIGIWICFVFISRYEKDVSEKRCFNLAVNATSFSYLLCSGSVPPRWARPSRWSGGPTGTSSSTTPSHSSVGWSFYQDIWDFKFMTSQMQTGACAGKKPQPSPWFTILHITMVDSLLKYGSCASLDFKIFSKNVVVFFCKYVYMNCVTTCMNCYFLFRSLPGCPVLISPSLPPGGQRSFAGQQLHIVSWPLLPGGLPRHIGVCPNNPAVAPPQRRPP